MSVAVSSVSTGYEHVAKLAEPGELLEVRGTTLKWYEVRRPDLSVSPLVREATRKFLQEQDLGISGELGYVLLHLAGPVHLLLVCTWRNDNEMWETVFVKTAEQEYALLDEAGPHRPAQCVWELGVTLHERLAWMRYLSSDR